MEKWQEDRIASALNGGNPTVLMRLKSGFAVMGDTQFLPGYCVLLAYPRASSLNELPPERRRDFLADMALLGDVILQTVKPLRINYEILCNALPVLHAHVIPRYAWENEERRRHSAMRYPVEEWLDAACRFDLPQYAELKENLKRNLMESYHA